VARFLSLLVATRFVGQVTEGIAQIVYENTGAGAAGVVVVFVATGGVVSSLLFDKDLSLLLADVHVTFVGKAYPLTVFLASSWQIIQPVVIGVAAPGLKTFCANPKIRPLIESSIAVAKANDKQIVGSTGVGIKSLVVFPVPHELVAYVEVFLLATAASVDCTTQFRAYDCPQTKFWNNKS